MSTTTATATQTVLNFIDGEWRASRTGKTFANLNPAGGALADDIVYSGPDAPSVFAHPVCLNTYRNGTKIGSEAPASYPFAP